MPLDKNELMLWRRRIQQDEAAQAEYHPRWRRAIRLFDTSYWDDLVRQNKELVAVNYSTTFITTLVSAVFARAPKWRIEAKRPGKFYRFAETMTVLMEQFKDEAKLKDLAIRCVVDAATCNIGWAELGFFPSVKEAVPQPELGEDEAGLTRRMKQLLTKLVQPELEESAPQGELHQQKQEGQFYLIRRSPWDVLVPTGYYEYEALPYLIVRERMSWGDFKVNPSYKNQDRIGVLAARAVTRGRERIRTSQYGFPSVYNGKRPSSLSERDPDRQIELFHVWDRRGGSVFTISETSDMPHREPSAWPYLAEGFPQIPLQFNYVPEIPDERDNFYGFSDVDPIISQVLEKSDLRTQQSAIRRRAIVKVFVQQGSATESQLMKLGSPDVEIIPVQNIQAIQVSPPIQMPPAVLEMEDRIDSDLSRDSGMSLLLSDAQQQGKIERATVANLAQQTTNIKTSYKVDRIEAWVKAIGRFQTGIFWQFLSRDEVGERLGHLPEPEEWIDLPSNITLAKQWINRELFLNVEAGSTKPLTVDVLERDNFMNSLTIIQQVSPALFKQLERQFISVLVKKFNEPALEALVLSALDPEEEQSAMMENQLLMQGMPQVVGPHDDHETHLQVHQQLMQHPLVAAHIQAHQVRLQELAQAQTTAGQGVRQKAAAPSAAEIGQGGITRGMDVQGASLNMGPGSQAAAG